MTFWFKAFHGMAYDIQWKVIADALRTQPDKVFCIWFTLLDYASTNIDRGSIEGFDVAVCKAAFGYKTSLVERVIDEFTLRGLLTDDNRIADWESMQGQGRAASADQSPAGEEDAVERARRKNRERQARFRDRRNAANVTDNVTDNATANVTSNGLDNAANVTDNAKVNIDIEKSRVDLSPHTPQGDNVTANVTDNVTPGNVTSAPEPAAEPRQVELSPEQPGKKKQARKDRKDEPPLRPEDWQAWYAMYPRHEARQAGILAWNAAVRSGVLPDLGVLLDALGWQVTANGWTPDRKQYTPLPATYLNARRWQDERPPVQVFSGAQRQAPQRSHSGPDEMFYVVEQNRRAAEQVKAMLAAEQKAKQEQENEYTDTRPGYGSQAGSSAGSGCELQQDF